MKLLNPSVEILESSNYVEHIEKCARICYKSESKGNPEEFVNRLIEKKHYAMLEHGTIFFKFKLNAFSPASDFAKVSKAIRLFKENPYSKVTSCQLGDDMEYYVTTNYRVIQENDLHHLSNYQCPPTVNHVKRYTFHIVTSIGIGRELTRHRVFSFAQESTRYCNYSDDKKFSDGIAFIMPYWLESNAEIKGSEGYDNAYEVFCSACEEAEGYYDLLKDSGFKAQDVREFLPLCTKTELCMTGFEDDWKNFLKIRLDGITGEPHPDMKHLCALIKTIEIKFNL